MGNKLKKIDKNGQQERTKLLKKAMLEALAKNLGIVSMACQETGVARSTHYLWCSVDKAYKRDVAEIDEIVLDFAESKLYKNINRGLERSTIFFLKTKGKTRGYVEKLEIDDTVDPEFRELIKELRGIDEQKQNKPRKTTKAKKSMAKKIS